MSCRGCLLDRPIVDYGLCQNCLRLWRKTLAFARLRESDLADDEETERTLP